MIRTFLKNRLFTVYAILVSTIGIVGCGDQLAPPDMKDDTGKERTRIISHTPLSADPPTVISTDSDGNDMITLGIGYIPTPPAASQVLITSEDSPNVLTIVDSRTGKEQYMLTNNHGDKIGFNSPTIAPSGEMIAYTAVWEGEAGEKDQRRAILANIDGSNATTFHVGAAYETFMRFSPDNTYLAFFSAENVRGEGLLHVIEVSSGNVKEIIEVENVANDGLMLFDWSPDSKALVYVDLAETGGITVIKRDGTGRHTLGKGFFPDWSPNGDEIVYVSEDEELTIARSDGSTTPESLGTFGTYPRWSPDGSKILFSEIAPGIVWKKHPPVLKVIDYTTKDTRTIKADALIGYWIE